MCAPRREQRALAFAAAFGDCLEACDRTRRDVAKATGINLNTVQSWTKGKVKLPTLRNLKAVCRYLDPEGGELAKKLIDAWGGDQSVTYRDIYPEKA